MDTSRTFDRRTMLLAGAGFGVAAAGLSACARGAGGRELSQPRSNVPGKYEDRNQKIVFWSPFSDVNGKTMASLVNQFNASQSDIYVDLQFQGAYNDLATKLTAALQGGTAPDLIVLNQVHTGKHLLRGLLQPLDDYFDDSFKDSYMKRFLDEWVVGGSLYQIPFARSTPILYYNKDVFKKAGLPDRGPKSWTELRSWNKDIKKVKDPSGKPMRSQVMIQATQDWFFQAEVWQFGGKLSEGLDVTADEGGAVECAEWFQREIKEEKSTYVGELEAFSNGFAATIVASTAALRMVTDSAKFEVGTDFMPKQKIAAVPTGGSGLMMFSGVPDERKEAAAEVVKFLGKPENSAVWTVGTGYLPIVKQARNVTEYQNEVKADPNFDVARKQLRIARPTDHIRVFITSSSAIMLETLDNIYQRGQEAQKALTKGADKLRAEAKKVEKNYKRYYD